jgi:hypothetical protein
MAVSTPKGTAGTVLAYKHMIDDQLWQRLVSRLASDKKITIALSERIMNETLGFLGLLAEQRGVKHTPSPDVDAGWCNFILHTREYYWFCRSHVGGVIHREQYDTIGVDTSDVRSFQQTMRAMNTRGPVDEQLWTHWNF